MARLLRTSFVALATAMACRLGDVTLPRGVEQVVVQCVLNAASSTQVLWIERSTAAGDSLTFLPRPLETPPTRVEVRDEIGSVFPFAADSADPTRFVAGFTPVPGRRYHLRVEAQLGTVQGTTVVPGQIRIVDPAADTVNLAPGGSLDVSWASGSSRHVAVYVTRDTANAGGFPFWVRDDTTVAVDTLFGGFFGFFEPTTVIWVLAADSVTARLFRLFYPERAFDGNLTGGAGAFGAVTRDRLVVRVQ